MVTPYDIAFPLYALFGLPYFFREGMHRDRFGERLGLNLGTKDTPSEPCIWIHGVSVGEIRLAILLGEELRKIRPELTILLTTTTPSARELAERILPRGFVIRYFPWDLSWVTNKIIRHFNPVAAIVIETEYWPNFLLSLERAKIPAFIANGRLSTRSFLGYKIFRKFWSFNFNRFATCFAQSSSDALRFKKCGMEESRIVVTENMKFDLTQDTINVKPIEGHRKLLILGYSTHKREEELIIQSMLELDLFSRGALLILAPRQLRRINGISKIALRNGLLPVLFSEFHSTPFDKVPADIILIDRIGELDLIYPHVEITIVGGSFKRRGAQNPLEAAGWGHAIVFGPRTGHFRSVCDRMMRMHAAIQVKRPEELPEAIRRLALDSSLRASLGKSAVQVIQGQRGATLKIAESIADRLWPKLETSQAMNA